jgi:hypothetical protein
MVGLRNFHTAQEVWKFYMFRMRQGESWLDVQRLNAHPAHQTPNPVTTNVMPLRPQLVANLSASVKRIRQMDLINLPHNLDVSRAQRYRSVIDAGSIQIQKIALPRHRKLILLIDHRFALASPTRPSAPDKKSFSIESWPIFA